MTARPSRIGVCRRVGPAGSFARGALCLVLVTALGACSPAGNVRPTPTAGPSASSARPASPQAATDLAEVARTAGTPITSGAVTLTVAALAMPVTVNAQDDGSVVLSVATAGGSSTSSHRACAVIAAPSGTHFEVESDLSATVLASTGAVVAALTAVKVVDGTGARLAAHETDTALLDVLVDAGPVGTATLTFGATPLVSAHWGVHEGGRSLAVVPAPWVRSGGLAAQDALWSALVAAEPDADSATMHDQMTCHALGAPTKASWNLEPWRPKVDTLTLLATGCNP